MTSRRTPSDPAAPPAVELVELRDALAVELAAVDVLVQLAPAAELGAAVDVLVAVGLVGELGAAAATADPAAAAVCVQLAPAAPVPVELSELGGALAVELADELAAVDVLVAAKLSGELGAALAATLAAASAVELAAVDVLVAVELVAELTGRAAARLGAVDALLAGLRARTHARVGAVSYELTSWTGARGGFRVISARRGRSASLGGLRRDGPSARRIEPVREQLHENALGERAPVLMVANRVEPVADEPCERSEHDPEQRRQRVAAGREHDQPDDHDEDADEAQRERAQPPRDDQDEGSDGKGGEHSAASWGDVPR